MTPLITGYNVNLLPSISTSCVAVLNGRETGSRSAVERGDESGERGDPFAERGDPFAERGDPFAERGDPGAFAARNRLNERCDIFRDILRPDRLLCLDRLIRVLCCDVEFRFVRLYDLPIV